MVSSIYEIEVTTGFSILTLDDTPNQGFGYTVGNVTLTGQTSGATNATGTITIKDGDVPDILTLVDVGSGYTPGEVVLLIQAGSNNESFTEILTVNMPANANILSNDITITKEQVAPGGGGMLRIYFSFDFASQTATKIGIFNNTSFKGFLNGDSSALINDKGYYRFDIDVEGGDNINFQTPTGSVDITNVNFFETQLVLVGA